MTEVPEHLLRRSQERRAALTGGEGGGEPPASPGEAPGTGAAASAVEPAGGGGEVTPAAAAPEPVVEPPKPVPPYVAASLRRPKVPRFVVPVLAALPVWGLIYVGAFTQPPVSLDPEVEHGKEVYLTNCSGCHGANGEGGTGRPLAGQVLLTFPNKADHIAWVLNGSPAPGTPYGDPGRPGGQRSSQSDGFGAMPGFEGTLSEEDIAAVVRYEREVLDSGEPEPSGAEGPEGNQDSGGGNPESNAQQQGGQTGSTSTSTGETSTDAETKTNE